MVGVGKFLIEMQSELEGFPMLKLSRSQSAKFRSGKINSEVGRHQNVFGEGKFQCSFDLSISRESVQYFCG